MELHLTPKEQEVWTALSWGQSISDTAHSLGVTENTVRTHLKHLHTKLGVSNRVQLALKFHGLLRRRSRKRPNH